MRMTRVEAEAALAQGLDLSDIGRVMDVRERVRDELEDTLDRAIAHFRRVADDLGRDPRTTLTGH